ncbi:MAG TPA: CPBP family intramembrane glutamic endopeptidase [Polyangiales bacterium]|nr:CPBP family intramembrane glutamic endopeptidase [Polyangiales bacterium]
MPSDRSDSRRPAPSDSRVWPFFATVIALTWGLQLPVVLVQRGLLDGPLERFLPLAMLGTFGPVLAAVLVCVREAGLAGMRLPFRGLRVRRLGARWYLLALLGLTALHVAGVAVYALAGGSAAGRWLYLPQNAQHVAAMLLIPWAEEPGWRGLALPRLRARWSPLASALILGGVWGAWHTMMFSFQGLTPVQLAFAYLNILAGSVLFSWLYEHTQGSLWIAVVAHMGAHLNNPTRALPGDLAPFAIYTFALCAAAMALVLADRARWLRSEGTRATALDTA